MVCGIHKEANIYLDGKQYPVSNKNKSPLHWQQPINDGSHPEPVQPCCHHNIPFL
jgi:hypothetical protein